LNAWRRDALVAVGLLLALLAWEAFRLDLSVMRRFGTAQGFAWRDAWLTSRLLHDGGRWTAGLVFVGLLLDAVRPGLDGSSRGRRLWGLLATLVCLVAVPALKRLSATSCPWDLSEFGGVAGYVPHWLPVLTDGGPGHCFPSGHAVAAFAFFGPCFAWRADRPLAARTWLAAVCAAGLLFGGVQVLRGAHYPSHVMWSAWLCWVMCALIAGPQSEPADAGRTRESPQQRKTP
jgi:membrane-associated PAP2 superfamily phosphatase